MVRSLDFYSCLVYWVNYAFYLLYAVIKYFVASVFWVLSKYAKEDEKDTKFAKITIPMQWLILQLFGGPLGITEIHANDGDHNPTPNPKPNPNPNPTHYIRNTKVSYEGIMVLSLIIITFGILTLSSAVDLSLLRITHVCSEDPHIDCYPQLISGANETLVDTCVCSISLSILLNRFRIVHLGIVKGCLVK